MAKAYLARNPESLLFYNGMDTIVTARISKAMRREMTQPHQLRLYEHSKALSVLAAKMHDRGFWVNIPERDRLSNELLEKAESKEKSLQALVAIPAFRCTPNDMRSLLFKRHATADISRFNLPDPIDERLWASKETISVDGDALLSLVINPGIPKDAKEIIDAYWDVEKLKKARSTFIVSDSISRAIGRDGRLRAGWNSLGADTGRWTCSQPNILTVPQYLRSMYGAPPGKVLVHADHSQQELRVMALVANDVELGRRLLTGDVYTEDTKDWFGLPASTTKETVKPAIRKQAKVVHLASQYAAGTKTVYMQSLEQDRTLTYKVVDILHRKFKKTYCDTVRYWEDESERVAACGYSESRILGRRRYYPRMPSINPIANYPIQSTAADIANLMVLKLDERLEHISGAQVVHFFYDATDVECFEKDVPEVQAIQKECMEMEHTLLDGRKLSIPCDQKVSNDWSKL